MASDEVVAPVTVALAPGTEFYRLWGADTAPVFPDDGSPPAMPTYFPPVGGFRFGLFTVPPESDGRREQLDVDAALAEAEERLPGLMGHMERDTPGMHTTDTVDYEFVVSGEVSLELDDGQEVQLRPGDTVVQNGTRHRWRNRGDEPCVLVVVLVGAERATSTEPT